MMLLMFIGASSGSTGGGIKTSSFAVILILIKNSLRGESNLSIGNRTISRETVHKTVALVFSAIVIILVALALLIFFADDHVRYDNSNRSVFIGYLFEVISAFGTVGLSMGSTMDLNALQKIIIIVTMFIGRVGPLTFVYSLQTPKKSLTYAEEKIMVG
jgi:trk system potassium uptake protein TrkH